LDTLTHIVVGACIGEGIAGKTLGKRAMVLGAFAHSLPDIDFITHFWLGTSDGLLAHRGFTHSLLFGFLSTVVLAVVAARLFPHRPVSRLKWLLLFSINIFAHIFIDTFNAYGTGWFEPFSHVRVSFHILYVADPFFSIWPFLGFLCLLILHNEHKRRRAAWILGVGMSATYLVYAIFNKISVDRDVRINMKNQGIASNNYILTPSPFNVWLWYVIAKQDTGFYTSYRSVFDSRKEMSFTYFPQNNQLLNEIADKDEKEDLLNFAGDFYTVEKWNDTLVFNVLRFGQVVGWYDPHGRFAFYYYMDRPGTNDLAVQRGRFERWNKETMTALIRRIMGN
jgi:inner membrane protein